MRAQSPTGHLAGTVFDQAGVRLAQATVTIRNTSTAAQMLTRPNTKGEYSFENIPEGKYSIRAAAKGFTTVQINDVLVENNKIATINVILPESSSRNISVVEVSAAPTPIDVPTAAPPLAPAAPTVVATAAAPTVSIDANEDAKIIDPKLIAGEINGMRDRLALSADQQTVIHAILEERQMEIAAIRRDTTLAAPVRRERIKSARLESEAKFRALLNENQLDEYEEILRERRERALQHKQEATLAVSSH
jgi:carboxypeptidase family protein